MQGSPLQEEEEKTITITESNSMIVLPIFPKNNNRISSAG